MRGHFIYGRIVDLWIFLRKETAETLAQLWAALGEAETWGELRELVGEKVTALLMETAECDQCPDDQTPFVWTPTIRELVETWSVTRLLEISAHELPDVAALAATPESLKLLAQYLSVSTGTEAHIVLWLVGLGYGVDRDDVLIGRCLAVPSVVGRRGDPCGETLGS